MQQTGDMQIDQLLKKFAASSMMVSPNGRGPKRRMAVKQVSAIKGSCVVVSKHFEQWIAPRLPKGWQVYASASSTPDEFGYTDRTIGGFPDHSASVIESPDGQMWMIDFTASQYGYDEFPMVLTPSVDGQSWQREQSAQLARPSLSGDDAPERELLPDVSSSSQVSL